MKHLFASLDVLGKGIRKADALSTLRASADPQEILLEVYGFIGQSLFDDGITAQQVADALKGPQSKVTVRINSPGGSAFEGVAIYNILKTSGKQVNVIVDGVAASAASLIAMAGDSITMQAGTMMMIHPAIMMAYGSSVDMRAAADTLEKVTGQMADIYAARSGQTREKVMEMLYAETWLTPQEAEDLGFVDNVSDSEGDVNAVAAAFNLPAMYEKTPDALKVFEKPEEPEPPKGTPVADLAKRALELY